MYSDKYFEKGERGTALFYAHKVVEEGWSRNVLKSFIDTNMHLRQGKALTSFSRLLPAPDSDLAQELTKDPYIFDFTEMTEPYKEREPKKALMSNISRFLLELGSGFAYVGEEYRLKVGHTEQFIDLLFYNIKLHAYCVIEVKTISLIPKLKMRKIIYVLLFIVILASCSKSEVRRDKEISLAEQLMESNPRSRL